MLLQIVYYKRIIYFTFLCLLILLPACGGGGDGDDDNPPVTKLTVNFNGVVSGTSAMIDCNSPDSRGLCPAENVEVKLYRVNNQGQPIGAALATVRTNSTASLGAPGLYNIHLTQGGGSSDFMLEANLNGTILRRLSGSGPISPAIEYATQRVFSYYTDNAIDATENIALKFGLSDLNSIYSSARNSSFSVNLSGSDLSQAFAVLDTAFGVGLQAEVDAAASATTSIGGTNWSGTVTTGSNTCGDPTGVSNVFSTAITVTENTTLGTMSFSFIHAGLGAVSYSGVVTGSVIEINSADMQAFPEDGGTTTQMRISLSIDSSTSISGLESWSWTSSGETCTGVDSFVLTRN